MKKYKIQITPRASASIRKIVNDLKRFSSSSYAAKVRLEIVNTVNKLKTFPESHQEFEEIITDGVVYRRALTKDYKIVFTVKEDVLKVVVIQIFHQHRGPEWIEDNVKP